MNELMNKELRMTSVEVVEMINQFRELEGNKSLLLHKTLLEKIRKEIETLEKISIINQHNFLPAEYKDKKGESRLCFSLNRDGIIQICMSESTLVRYKTVDYINSLETQVTSQISSKELEKLSKDLEEVKQYYRLPHSEKINFNKRIKSKLGLDYTPEEVEDVKEYVFIALGIEKWEDLPINQRAIVLDLIDRRSKIIVGTRVNLFNWNQMERGGIK